MEDIHIQGESGTFFTPNVDFHANSGHCSIVGESYLENSFEFYDKLIQWVVEYFAEGGDALVLDIKLTYFNTSSSRALLDLFIKLKELEDDGKNVTANWHYNIPDDTDIEQEVEDFIDDSGLQINLIEVES